MPRQRTPKKGLFALTHIQGNSAYARMVVRALESADWIEPTFVELHPDDFDHTRRRPDDPVLKPAHLIREKYEREALGTFDFFFANAYEFTVGLEPHLDGRPLIVGHDSTPRLTHGLEYLAARTFKRRVRTQLKNLYTDRHYRRAFGKVALFMPWSSWCGESLSRDYGVPSDRIQVRPPAVDPEVWSPRGDADMSRSLLLVGNEFDRKGGALFVEIVERLAPHGFTGVVVSNDPSLRTRTLPESVRVVSGLTHDRKDELIDCFREAGLFVFPSTDDKFGIVLVEAAAVGTPLLARNVGGGGTVARPGVSGTVLPYDATVDEWVQAVLSTFEDRDGYAELSRGAREMVLREFTQEAFTRDILAAIDSVTT